jgi:hypothetical protein
VETIIVELENDEKTTSNHTEKKHVLEFQQDVNSSIKEEIEQIGEHMCEILPKL